MKINMLFLVICFLLSSVNAQDAWQQKIDEAFGASLITGEDHLSQIVETVGENTGKPYWHAYACYRAAIHALIQEEMERGRSLTEQGIGILEGLPEMESEDHALLASLQGVLIIFEPAQAMALSMKADKNFQDALKKDDQNMRAYLGLGRGDFYRPVEYGGGQVVEKHLQKALSLPAGAEGDPNAPSWGREEAFMFLAMYYQREERKPEGILICKRGLKEYPDHEELKRILGELQKS